MILLCWYKRYSIFLIGFFSLYELLPALGCVDNTGSLVNSLEFGFIIIFYLLLLHLLVRVSHLILLHYLLLLNHLIFFLYYFSWWYWSSEITSIIFRVYFTSYIIWKIILFIRIYLNIFNYSLYNSEDVSNVLIFYHLYLFSQHLSFSQICNPCLILDIVFLLCQFFLKSLLNGGYSNFDCSSFYDSPFSGIFASYQHFPIIKLKY